MPDFPDDVVERVARAILAADESENDYLIQAAVPEAYATLLATAALAAAWEWKPIETAPRDGTRFLACFLKNRYEQIFPIAWSENVYDEGFGWTLDAGGSAVLMYDQLTHWMPLPPPPEARDD